MYENGSEGEGSLRNPKQVGGQPTSSDAAVEIRGSVWIKSLDDECV